jgi:hypothetical protein
MDRYEYQCWDGGPHVVLPTAVAQSWRGHESTSDDLLDPASDYGRACQIEQPYGFIDVGSARALVLPDPPLVAWDPRSAAEPLFFVLLGWDTDDTDGLLDRAKTKTELRDMEVTWVIPEDGVRVIYAGDDPDGTVGGRIDIPMAAGSYALFKGEYRVANDGHVVVLKFVQEHAMSSERQ